VFGGGGGGCLGGGWVGLVWLVVFWFCGFLGSQPNISYSLSEESAYSCLSQYAVSSRPGCARHNCARFIDRVQNPFPRIPLLSALCERTREKVFQIYGLRGVNYPIRVNNNNGVTRSIWFTQAGSTRKA